MPQITETITYSVDRDLICIDASGAMTINAVVTRDVPAVPSRDRVRTIAVDALGQTGSGPAPAALIRARDALIAAADALIAQVAAAGGVRL